MEETKVPTAGKNYDPGLWDQSQVFFPKDPVATMSNVDLVFKLFL